MNESINGGDISIEIRPDLEELIRRYNNQAEELVRLAHKRWSPNLREYIRTETGLRMGVTDKDVSTIPMSVENGIPSSLSQVIPRNTDILDLLFILPRLEITVEGLDELLSHSLLIDYENLAGDSKVSTDELLAVSKYTSNVVENLKQRKLLETITGINEDILGSYCYTWKIKYDDRRDYLFGAPDPKITEKQWIEIYWLPIALTASLLDVSIEALTVVVMAHELAHAYTHRGADIDGERWDTPAFYRTKREIKEGLAQFYTACICHRLKERFPSALIAYEKLLSKQSGPYIVHKKWAVSHKAQKEVIRAATIKCRKSELSDYVKFLELINSEAKALA